MFPAIGYGVGVWLLVAVAVVAADVSASDTSDLPDMGAAAPIELTTQDGERLSLADLRGKVVLVNFFYAECTDVCLTSTAKLAMIQKRLGQVHGSRVQLLSITLDPEHDTPAVLKSHAKRFGARLDNWHFLTGSVAQVKQVANNYGVAFNKSRRFGLEHNNLASIIDNKGHLRVQYMGVMFDPWEMYNDLVSLAEQK